MLYYILCIILLTPCRKDIEKTPTIELEEQLRVYACEILKIQQKLKDRTILNWYDSLSSNHKSIHDFFEVNNNDIVEKAPDNAKWVAISMKEIQHHDMTLKKYDLCDLWYAYFDNVDTMYNVIDGITQEELEFIMFLPIDK